MCDELRGDGHIFLPYVIQFRLIFSSFRSTRIVLRNIRGEIVKDALELCQLCFELSPLVRDILTFLYQIRRLSAKLFDEWHALLGELDKVDKC